MNIFSKIQIGINYMNKWPLEPLLNPVFPENRAKKAMLFARKILPPFIVLVLLWDIYLGGGFSGIPLFIAMQSNIYMTVISTILLALIPVQGYLWFYVRATSPLNDKQKKFYNSVCVKLDRQPSLIPTLQDLETVINAGLKKFGSDFLKEL